MKEDRIDEERIQRLSHFSVERSPDVVLWVLPNAQIYRANASASELFGYSNDELTSMTIPEFNPNIPADAWLEIWTFLRQKKVITRENDIPTRDGQIRTMEITTNFIEFEGQEFSCSFGRDVTRRKRAEKALKSAYQEINQLKDRLEAENVYLQEEIRLNHNFEEIIGVSKVLKKELGKIEQVAASDATVLIQGETGTGKELLARAVHNLSAQKHHPLVKVNCAALPGHLIESELFGHEKGAFTGALNRRIGRFELADNGTIFLDEIGDLPLELQAKLLRVLQEGEFERLGSSKTTKVKVRVIAATNRDLSKLIEEDKFRQDLYFRLNVFPLRSPSLRERKEDIPLLARHFLKKFSTKLGKSINTIPGNIMNALNAYNWPGNIRELENIMERAVIISPGDELVLGEWLTRVEETTQFEKVRTLSEVEKEHILKILHLTNWRIRGNQGAAQLLGLKPTTLEFRMSKLGIQRAR